MKCWHLGFCSSPAEPGLCSWSAGLEERRADRLCDNRFSSGHSLCCRLLRDFAFLCLPFNWGVSRQLREVGKRCPLLLSSRAFLMDEEICAQSRYVRGWGWVPWAGLIPGPRCLCSGCPPAGFLEGNKVH